MKICPRFTVPVLFCFFVFRFFWFEPPTSIRAPSTVEMIEIEQEMYEIVEEDKDPITVDDPGSDRFTIRKSLEGPIDEKQTPLLGP